MVIACVGCAAGTWVSYAHATALRDHGVRTQATVLKVHDGKSSYVLLEFEAEDGRRVTAEVGNYYWDPHPRVGDRPVIVYDPDDPEFNVADVRTGPDFFTVWFLAGCTVVAGALIAPTFSGRIDWDAWAR